MNTYWNIRSILHNTKQLKDVIARRNGWTRFSYMIQNIDRHVMSPWFLFYQIFWTYCFSNLHGTVAVVIEEPLDLQLYMKSVSITTNVVSSNHIHGEVYSIQHYVIKFVSDWREVGGFLQVSDFLHQYNWPARYNWNNAESGVKHHKPNQPAV
jgi:hypothetical protein